MKPLTERQLAICARIAEGWQNKQIADAEQKSLESVKHQITAIMVALRADNRAQVAAWYVRSQVRR